MAAAISSGSAKRSEGISFLKASPTGPSQALCPRAVRTTVGETQLTRMPLGPHSLAMTLVMAMMPPLLAQ